MNSLAQLFNKSQPLLFTAARVITGIVFFWHGLSKFRNGLDGVEGFFDASGVPIPAVSALVVAVVELVGGLALIAGIGTRLVSILLAIIMIGALIFVKAEQGITGGANTDLGLVSALLTFIGFGGGPLSADTVIGLEDPVANRRTNTITV